jgi:Zn-dependent peptidase ImmA (M78 family)
MKINSFINKFVKYFISLIYFHCKKTGEDSMYDSIEAKAEELIRASRVEEKFPIPLVPIAECLGYNIEEFEPGNNVEKQKISGLVYYSKGSILVNATEPEARKRFTIAHEMGHIVLHGEGKNYVDYRTSLSSNEISSPKEKEANRFAAALLMPKKNFSKIFDPSKNNFIETAAFFGVSLEAAKIRASSLDLA